MKNDPELDGHADGAARAEGEGEDISISRIADRTQSWQFEFGEGKDPEVRLILLSGREAEDAWKTSIDGSMHLLETEQDFFTDEKSFVLQSEGDARCDFTVFPSLHGSFEAGRRQSGLHPQLVRRRTTRALFPRSIRN